MSTQSLDFSRLWGALSAPRNLTALSLLTGTLLSAVLVLAAFSAIGRSLLMEGHYDSAKILGLLGGLLTFAIWLYGFNAVGLVLMAEARQTSRPSIRDAILISLATGHRLIGLVLVNLALVLVAVLAVTLLLFVCKIPGLGAFLYTFVYPLSALFLGLLIVGQYLVVMPLAAPAIWDGHGVFAAMSRLYSLVRRKLADVLMLELVLFIMLAIIGGLMATILGAGIGITSALSTGILSSGGGMNSMEIIGMLMGGGHGDGYGMAFMLGSSVLFALAFTIPSLISIKGFALIFLQASEGVDFAADEAVLQQHKENAQRKLQEAREEARRKTEELQQQRLAMANSAPAPSATPAAPQAIAAASCPKCHAAIAADDAFCGECGHRL